jgi:hypothetical protein
MTVTSIAPEHVIHSAVGYARERIAKPGAAHPNDFAPDPEVLRQVVDCVFWASQSEEEGKAAMCRMAFDDANPRACRFLQSRPVTVENLRKLSPFVAESGTFLQVGRSGLIEGVLAGSSGSITVHASGPGRVAIGMWPEVLYVLDRGSWVYVHGDVAVLLQVIAAFFPSSESLTPLLRGITIVDLVRQARSRKRGALILIGGTGEFVGVDLSRNFQVAQFMSQVDLRIDWWAGMPSTEQMSRASDFQLRTSMFREVFAGGATVDGATVMNGDLEVLGFGAKIKADLSDDFTVQEISLPNTSEAEVLRSQVGGMRHQSAACFIRMNPSSIAICISQDGYVSVFGSHKGSGVVTMIRGLEFYYECESRLRVG